MNWVLIVVFVTTGSGFSAEFEQRAYCERAAQVVREAGRKAEAHCLPKSGRAARTAE